MALDFPASPSVGQKYPASPLAGIPTYTWDGEKWTTQGGSIVSASPGTLLPLMNAKPALVGVSTNFSREDHVHPVDTSRASFDAMAYSGLQINGGMEVSQEKANNATTLGGNYVCDGWKIFSGGSQLFSAAVAGINYFVGFPWHFYITITTAQPALAAGDYTHISQYIEGYRTARLSWGTANAQPITIGFWSAHHRAGVYGGSVRNVVSGNPNRSYAFTYTQTVADVAQYNTITVPGDTAGTWAADNTTGVLITFAMAAGTNSIAPSANAWIAGSYTTAPGQINGVAATSDVFRITGVTVHPGNEAPSAARSPFVMRPFGQELEVCKRYWQTVYMAIDFTSTTAGTASVCACTFTAEMRAAPTVTLATPDLFGNIATPTSNFITTRKVAMYAASVAAGRAYYWGTVVAEARL